MDTISPNEIKYLSFEGGGGKGNAYLGAIKALEELKVLEFYENRLANNIWGVSGASAGAITALLLGTGYSYEEIREIMLKTDFNNFFDLPTPGDEIVAGEDNFSRVSIEKRTRIKEDFKKLIDVALAKFADFVSRFATPGRLFNLRAWKNFGEVLLLLFIVIAFPIIVNILKLYEFNSFLFNRLKNNSKNYMICLLYDFGLFSGKNIHKFFNDLITNKIREINGRDTKDRLWTFKEHFDIFQQELVFTSVNISTETVHFLSHKTTPDLPVSTAVRMSMSLPLVYKPVIINEKFTKAHNSPSYLEGYWVDGGLFNNAPVQAFDGKKLLLFRLHQPNINRITSLKDFLHIWLIKVGAYGSGSGQISETTFAHFLTNVINCNIDNTDLLKFNLSETELAKLEEKNYKITKDFLQKRSNP